MVKKLVKLLRSSVFIEGNCAYTPILFLKQETSILRVVYSYKYFSALHFIYEIID